MYIGPIQCIIDIMSYQLSSDAGVLAWRSFPFSSFPLASSSFSRWTKRSAMPSKSFCVIAPSLSKSIRWKYVFILRTQKSDMVAGKQTWELDDALTESEETDNRASVRAVTRRVMEMRKLVAAAAAAADVSSAVSTSPRLRVPNHPTGASRSSLHLLKNQLCFAIFVS